MADNLYALDDSVLEAVTGGATKVDWQLFSAKFMSQINNFNISGDDLKEVVALMKSKDWTGLQIKILPFAAGDQNLLKLIMECL